MNEEGIVKFTAPEDELACLIASNNKTDIDEALALSGPFGKFQVLVQIFFMYAVFTNAYQAVTVYFVGDNPSWTCVSTNTSNFCMENFGKQITNTNRNFSRRCEMKRDEWTYTKPKTYSYITEFDLICEKNSIGALIGGAFFIGSAIGGIITGIMADVYGRKVVFGISLVLITISSIGCSFVKEVWQLILLRALIGAGQGTGVGISFIYLGEFIPTSHRSLSSNIFQISFSLASFLIVTVAYFVRNWRKLQLYLSFPSMIAMLLIFYVPQSPRWLLATGKVSKAENVVQKISEINGKFFNNLKLKEESCDVATGIKRYTYVDLFSSCKIMLLVLSQCVLWFTGDLLFFGLTFGASNLGGNMYESFTLISLPDLPCCFFTIYLCNRFGRKKTVLICNLVGGIVTGAIAIFIKNLNYGYVISIVLSITGKCFINVAFNGAYIWTFELFPTVVRSQGFSMCLVVSRIGGVFAPFLSEVLQNVDPTLPYLVMGTMGILSSFVGLILPETNRCPSREKYDDFFPPKQNLIVDNSINEITEDMNDCK